MPSSNVRFAPRPARAAHPRTNASRGARDARPARALLLAAVVLLGAATPAPAQEVGAQFVSGLRWRSIGPYRSGNVAAVAGVPGDPTIYYAGMPEGGVWKTTDGGTLWTPIFDSVHVASVGALAVAPSNPDIVYVGTGDPSGWSFTPGDGVYRSTNAGRSWHNVGLRETRYINDLVVDPTNPDIVIVGALGAAQAGGRASAERGVYRTTDGGATWQHVLYVDPYTGVRDLVADAADPHIIFVAFQRAAFGMAPSEREKLASLGTGIYKSTDEGATWTPVRGNGLPSGVSSWELAVAAGTHGMRVYAEAQGTGRDAGGIYRSDDGGATWMLGTREIGSAGGRIYVDPKNPDVVYLMGTSMYRSLDGGRTFASYKGAPGGDDNRELWIDPSNPKRMLMGADQGPTISVDGGESWTPWYNLPNGQFYNVVTDGEFPYHVCGSQQDSGTACVASRSDYGRIRENDWYAVGGFERGDIVPDPRNPRWIYTQGWYHALRRYDRTTGQVVVLYTPAPEDRFGGLPPIAFSPQDSHLLYMAAQYVLASNDGGRSWRHVSPDLTVGAAAEDTAASAPRFRRFERFINAMALSPVTAGEIWVGTNDGLVQLTRDAGRSWRNITPSGLPPRAVVEVLEPSHRVGGTAYAAVSAPGDDRPYIYRTADFGKHWTRIVTGLPENALVRVVREDPVATDVLYAGTVTGVWVSFDRGDHWQSLQLNLPNTVVSDIAVHGNDLAISTYGRALWVLDDVTPLRQARTAVAAARSSAYLYPPEVTYRVRWDNDQDTPRPPEVPSGENAPEGAILYYYLSSPPRSLTLSIRDAAGRLVREYTTAPPPPSLTPNVPEYWFAPPTVLATTPGMHRIVWDLRYPDPKILPYGYYGNLLTYTEYTLTWHAVKGHTPRVQPPGPLVVPGKYQAELTVDGHRYVQPLTLVNDPRVNVLAADLAAQLQAERRMTAAMATSYAGFEQVQALRKALGAFGDASTPLPADVAAAARALDTTLAHLAQGPGGGFGVANRDLARHLEDADFGDLRPTASDLAALDISCRQVDAALSGLQRVLSTDVPRLDAMLQRASLQALPSQVPIAGPACGASAAMAADGR